MDFYKKIFKLTIIFSCLYFFSIEGAFPHRNSSQHNKLKLPWFTGPLLTPSARTVLPGSINVEPYLFWTVINGKYDNHWNYTSIPTFKTLAFLTQIQTGLTNRIEFSTLPQIFFNETRGRSSSGFGDLPLGIGIQLLEGKDESWIPYIKLGVNEFIPTGRYQKLKAENLGTDAHGEGSYQTHINLTISKLFFLGKEHYFNTRFNTRASFFQPVHVKGINAYGGDPTTKGKVYPGTIYRAIGGAEYSFNRHWVLSLDLELSARNKISFKGSSILPINKPSSARLSAAPAIEYNWNSNIGIIIGSWFTITGRNTGKFISAVGAFNYSYP